MLEYRSRAYERYDRKQVLNYKDLAIAYYRRISKRLKIERHWRCLDIACGFGNFLAYLRSMGVESFLGIDSSEEAIKVVEIEFGPSKAICTDAFKFIEQTSSKYDLISALDFIEHLHKDELFRFLSMLDRIQSAGGMLLLRTPNANGLFGMAARYNDITHEICFTPGAISDVLARTGYRVTEIWEDGAERGRFLQTSHWLVWSMVKFLIRSINAAETGQWGDGILTRNMWVLAKKL